jgi:hypothetical protein
MSAKTTKLTQTAICVMFMLAPLAAHSDTQADYAAALNDWQQVLSTYVDAQGRTDFIALADNSAELQNYVTFVATYGPASNPADFPDRESALAYYVNTYNALAMQGVVNEGIPDGFDSFFKRAGFFRFRGIAIDGEQTNLYDYENKVIRPLNDPRIHFALNCMVRDCPRLPQTTFTADNVDEQLEQATREFINSDKYVQVDQKQKQVRVSAIFNFYTKDFVPSGKTRDLPDYINRYRSEPLPEGYKVRYLKYDWTLNQQPAARLQVPDSL